MAWIFALLLLIIAGGFYAVREKFARFQSLLMGGHLSPGCVLGEVAMIVIVALLIVAARLAGIIH
jgi:hypothetical protein